MGPLLIFLIAFTATGVRGRRCYVCSTNPAYSIPPYDPACGDDNYDGNSEDNDWYPQCRVSIEAYDPPYSFGHVFRGHSKNAVAMCDYAYGYYNDGLACYCETKKCNSGLCQQCQHNETTTLAPTTVAPQELSCYSCSDCEEVDEDTTTIQGTEYASCSTSFLLNLGRTIVIRGASSRFHHDGTCIDEGNAITCYCTSSFCNDQSYAKIMQNIPELHDTLLEKSKA